jgi:hypothetical protein
MRHLLGLLCLPDPSRQGSVSGVLGSSRALVESIRHSPTGSFVYSAAESAMLTMRERRTASEGRARRPLMMSTTFDKSLWGSARAALPKRGPSGRSSPLMPPRGSKTTPEGPRGARRRTLGIVLPSLQQMVDPFEDVRHGWCHVLIRRNSGSSVESKRAAHTVRYGSQSKLLLSLNPTERIEITVSHEVRERKGMSGEVGCHLPW